MAKKQPWYESTFAKYTVFAALIAGGFTVGLKYSRNECVLEMTKVQGEFNDKFEQQKKDCDKTTMEKLGFSREQIKLIVEETMKTNRAANVRKD